MLDGGHIAWLIVFCCYYSGLMFIVPFVFKVDILALRISQSSSQRVEYGSSGTDIPLLDHRGVNINIFVASHQLPDLSKNTTLMFHSTLTDNESTLRTLVLIKLWHKNNAADNGYREESSLFQVDSVCW